MKSHPKPAPLAPTPERPRRLWIALGLAALAIALFWPATGYDFINFDDPLYVEDNPHINSGITWTNLRWAFTTVHENWWLPLLWISFMLDTDLFGPGPFGHHLVNILLHALNTVLLFWILSRMTKSIWASAFVAALFAIHPMRVEAVAWIVARKDMLSGLIYMLALLAYLRHADRPSTFRLGLVALLMLLGLMSKAILITLPPILLLLDFWPLRRAGDPRDPREWKTWGRLVLEKWPLLLMAAAFVLVNLFTHTTGRGDTNPISAATRLGLIPPNYFAYLGKMVWPHPLSIVYPEYDVANWTAAMASLVALAALTGLFWSQRGKRPYLLVGWLWFLIALFPVARGLRLGIASMADRFTYIPAIGLFLMLAWAAGEFAPRLRHRTVLLAAAAALLLAACFATARAYLPLWRSSEPIFRHAMAVTPKNYVAAVHVAATLEDQGRQDEKIACLRYALECYPPCAVAHTGLAKALHESNPLQAAWHLEMAARFAHPREWDLHTIIGEQYALLGNLPESIRHFRQALLVKPDWPDTQLNLGAALLASGQPAESLACADAVLRIHPQFNRAYFSSGQALLALGRHGEAVQAFETANRLLPGKLEYQNALALAFAADGQASKALALFRDLLRENPKSPEILNNLASILADTPTSPVHDPAAAVAYALQAAELTAHKDPRILDTLTLAYVANGQCDLALPICRKAEPLAKRLRADDLAAQIRARAERCLEASAPAAK